MPSKEELHGHIKVGLEYAARDEIPVEGLVAYLTSHLWGVVGMWLKYPEKIPQKKNIITNLWNRTLSMVRNKQIVNLTKRLEAQHKAFAKVVEERNYLRAQVKIAHRR